MSFENSIPVRKTDLDRLLRVQDSFCIFSVAGNGTTELMNEYAEKVGGIYIDSNNLNEGEERDDLIQKLCDGNSPILLDNASRLFEKIGGHKEAVKYLLEISGKRQIGLRIHPEDYKHEDYLFTQRFKKVEIGKISYLEFIKSVHSRFEGNSTLFPERFIEYAYNTYYALDTLNGYIAEAYKLMMENPGISEIEVKRQFENTFFHKQTSNNS